MNDKALPISALLALADAMADAATANTLNHEIIVAVEAYRAARALSPVTLEEHLLIDEHNAQREYLGRIWDTGTNNEPTEECQQAWARTLETEMERREHARRLAGEGGA